VPMLVLLVGGAAVAVGAAPAAKASTPSGAHRAATSTYRRATKRHTYRNATKPRRYGSTYDASAAFEATVAYRKDMGRAATSLASDVQSLGTAARAGDLAAARSDYVAAETEYDSLRPLVGDTSSTALSLDGLPGGATSSLYGLHLVERDLWAVDGTMGTVGAADAAAHLDTLTPTMELALAATEASPEAIVSNAVEELDWLVAYPAAQREEVYSHLDTVDADAAFSAAQAAFRAVEPVARATARGATATVERQFTALAARVAALGPASAVSAGLVPDSAVRPATWTAVDEQADDTAAALTGLLGPLGRYGDSVGYGSAAYGGTRQGGL
jgi:iron uptake system EfeUOB component EfeO/EfeM